MEAWNKHVDRYSLKKDSVTFLGALALSAAFMGPAVSVFYNMVPTAAAAGAAFPLSLVVSMVAVLFVAASVIAFSRKVQGASFAFTFTSAGLGPKAGFFAGWIVLLAYAMISPITYAGFGIMVTEFLSRQFGIHISWLWGFVGIGAIVSFLSYAGISRSTRVTLIFLVLEVTVMLVLFGSVIFGGVHNSAEPFMLHNAPHGLGSIAAGMVFGILSFTGFEASANLGEETQNASRTIPRAVICAVVLMGIFYILGAYVGDVAFGLDAKAFASNAAPFDDIARRFWGNNWAWLIDLTVLNSVFANAVAGQVSIVRNLFSLGRASVLPRILGRTNGQNIPSNAIIFDFVLTMVLGLAVGAWQGPWGVWNLFGTIMAIGLILAYGLVSLSLPFFFLRKYRSEFSPIWHGLVPAIGVLLLLAPLYGTIWPAPAFPFNLAPYIVIAWILIGAGYLFKRSSGTEDLAAQFGASLTE